MRDLKALVKRDTKLFFKDKGLFFTSMVAPLILLLLYVTFLGKVYKDSIAMTLQEVGLNIAVPDKLTDAFVGGQLMSSLLAVCCVTVAFCSNMLMVNDKINGSVRDITITPVKPHIMSLAYYISTAFSTLIGWGVAAAVCMIYIASGGWYMSVSDVLFMLLDVFLLVMFGTALSSIINIFLTSQGQISAVGTVVSAGYGFICGAYMPISNFSDGLQKVISFLPGTYGTSLIRNHSMRGVFEEMEQVGFPPQIVEAIKDSVDCNLYFFDEKVPQTYMYIVLIASIVVCISIYVVLNHLKKRG